MANIANNRITENGTMISHLELTDTLIGSAIFDKISFERHIHVKNCSTKKLIRFFNCTFNSLINIKNSALIEVHFVNCTFLSTFTVTNTTIEHFVLSDCKFNKGIETELIKGNYLLLDQLISENARLRFIKPDYNAIQVTAARDNSEYIFSTYDTKVNTYVPNIARTSFSYLADSQFKGLLLITGFTIGTLTLNGHNNTGRLMFQQLKVGLVSISQFTNSGLISFSNITPEEFSSVILCHRSNLGKCEIYDVNFAQFKEVVIDNTNVQDIITTNITWCRSIRSVLSGIDKQAHLRENYRQLKNVMIRQNDKVQELAYYRQEMNALLKTLHIEGSNRADRFIIWTNKISNDHGLSWQRAFGLLILATFTCYLGINLIMGFTHFDNAKIFKHVALFFESMNPVRKFSAIYNDSKDNQASSLGYLIDVLYRFLASYLIFQFISAFRKYVKK